VASARGGHVEASNLQPDRINPGTVYSVNPPIIYEKISQSILCNRCVHYSAIKLLIVNAVRDGAEFKNKLINSWVSWFIFNLQGKNRLTILSFIHITFLLSISEQSQFLESHLYILEWLSSAAPPDEVHLSLVLGKD
jgi:hypothetical protein